ncbi:Anthranilate synthase component 1 [Folsomia candida]|uniref:Anthranilate synthase component 1 n=1 Tax=Folsomia candida TaxID=158441 RepID=A0A226D1L5_FOLCA|nr:Anthranilate synthase component 1 [Folsomia candida]
MFSVVKFVSENSVSTVPSSWAIASQKSPDPTWTAHPIKFYKTADTLLAAKSIEKEAEKAEALDTSDISNLKRVAGRVLESRSKKAKKIQPPTTSSSEDDDSVAEVDDDLDLAGFSGNIFSQDDVDAVQTRPNFASTSSSSNFTSSLVLVSDEQNRSTTSNLQNSTYGSSENLNEPLPTSALRNSTTQRTGRQLFSEVHPRPKGGFEEVVINLLTELKTDVAELLRRSKVNNPAKKIVSIPFKLPLSLKSDLDKLEAWIRADQKNSSDLVEHLSQWGGETPEKVTRRILGEIFEPVLARQFNYTGGGKLEKHSFSALELHNIVVAAARECDPAKNTEIAKIERVILNYFRDTRDKKGPGARVRSRHVSKKTTIDTAGGSTTSIAGGNQ